MPSPHLPDYARPIGVDLLIHVAYAGVIPKVTCIFL
jgi:hypothetical protein